MKLLLSIMFALFLNACIVEEEQAEDQDQGIVQCTAYPTCQIYEIEVDTCDGLDNCQANRICGSTVYCQVKEECLEYAAIQRSNQNASQSNDQSTDPSNDQSTDQKSNAAVAEAPGAYPRPSIDQMNRILECDANDLSDLSCDYDETDRRSCFVYQSTDPCLGTKTQYCRPVFQSMCELLLSCPEGQTEIDHCYLADENCNTLNSCAGTIFCQTNQDIGCAQAQAPVETPIFADCEDGTMNSEPCSPQELEMNACGAMIVPNRCMGSDLYYCHLPMAQCAAVPVCQDFEMEVMSCEGLENCVSHSICGATIYCQTKPECVDAMGQAQDPAFVPTPDTPNRIDSCDPAFISDMPCDMSEIAQNTCFDYAQNDGCFSYVVKACRPRYEGACAFLLECNPGDTAIDSCYIGDAGCYTVTGCTGTVFCRRN